MSLFTRLSLRKRRLLRTTGNCNYAITSPLPRTDEMNVTHWSNAYRSGDYIGRSLWVGQWLDRNESGDPEQPASVADATRPRDCDEMCIGLGAHTHYWDRSAPDVAERLDGLIVGENPTV